MERGQESLVDWALKRAEEYLESASNNLEKNRLYPAAEDIFRIVETSLEALLYHYGVRKIEFPGKRKKFTGRLALQFLIRDILLKRDRVSNEVYDKYLELATNLHSGGYEFGRYFDKKDLKKDLEFSEDLFFFVKSQIQK